MYHKTGIMANRAALTELGEWNCWLEERDCSSLDFRSYSSQQGLFSCRRLSCAQGYVSTCEAWCASYRCLSSLQYYTESVGEGSRESRELGLSPSSSREEKKRFLSSLKSGDRICWRSWNVICRDKHCHSRMLWKRSVGGPKHAPVFAWFDKCCVRGAEGQ